MKKPVQLRQVGTLVALKRKYKMKVEELFEEDLFEMSNLTKAETGLDVTIWVSVKSHPAGPRIKVNLDSSLSFNRDSNFSVSISDNPTVVAGDTEKNIIKKLGTKKLEDVYDWVKLNKNVLDDYWNSKISTKQLLDLIQELK
jgi:hypothetical protein